ncbi:hypothetical protein K402DRAFT_46423 [Aulographum hederae CBS 113979]|uniref:Uncharacterized protein n=1 Tax=Aulographum hederae CBS 113979 TaxID=1176131 RepID=A0A6G1H3U5_9PEZI|nr:hypothetical protein K402DRAFT_46423 [Aulographum hederae CBS 113979]
MQQGYNPSPPRQRVGSVSGQYAGYPQQPAASQRPLSGAYNNPNYSPHNQQSQWQDPQRQSQAWDQHAPPPPPPPKEPQHQQAPYNPTAYGPMPGAGGQQPAYRPSYPPVAPRPQQYSAPPQPQAPPQAVPPRVPTLAPEYQAQVAQNQQGWPQHPQYSTKPPTNHYAPGAQSQAQAPHQAQPVQHAPSAPPAHHVPPGAPVYDHSAPPPPSATPGGSYFPPSSGPSTAPPHSALSNVMSPDESHPAYVPPSLSGQGIASYMPSNTNPAPGVYVPPPPENVPAWSQAQHAPLAGGAKRFAYTKYNPGTSAGGPSPTGRPPSIQQPRPQYDTQVPAQQAQPVGIPAPYSGTFAGQPAQQQQQQVPIQQYQGQSQGQQSQQQAPVQHQQYQGQSQQPQQYHGQQQTHQTQQYQAQEPQQPHQYQNQQSLQHLNQQQPQQYQGRQPQQPAYQDRQQAYPDQQQAAYSQPPHQPQQAQQSYDQAQSAPPQWQHTHAGAYAPQASSMEQGQTGLGQTNDQPPAQGPPHQAQVRQPDKVESKRPSSSGVRFEEPKRSGSSGVRFEEPKRPSSSGVRFEEPKRSSSSGVRFEEPERRSSSTVHFEEPDYSNDPSPAHDTHSHRNDSYDQPISPIQHTASMGFSQTLDNTPPKQFSPPRKPSEVSRQSSQRFNPAEARTATPVTSFALGGGGPSDWEHFDPSGADEVDDTEEFSQKSPEKSQTPPMPDSVELPAGPSPIRGKMKDREESVVSQLDDDWPSPPAPAPAPLNIRRSESRNKSTPPIPTQTPPAATSFTIDDGSAASFENSIDQVPVVDPIARANDSPSNLEQIRSHGAPPPDQEFQRPTFNFEIEIPGRKTTPAGQASHGYVVNAADRRPLSVVSSGFSMPAHQSPSVQQQQQQQQRDESSVRGPSPIQHVPSNEARASPLPEQSAATTPAPPAELAPGLDQWFKNSLQRYIGMLYRESGASAIDEKHKIFKDFMTEEAKLRGIDLSTQLPAVVPAASPALGAQQSSMNSPAQRPKLASPVPSDSFVMVDQGSEEYSPGGRPLVNRPKQEQDVPKPVDRTVTPIMTAGSQQAGSDSEANQATSFDERRRSSFIPYSPTARDNDSKLASFGQIAEESKSIPAGYKPYRNSVVAPDGPQSSRSAILTPSSSAAGDSRVMSPVSEHVQAPEQGKYKPYSPGDRPAMSPAIETNIIPPTVPGSAGTPVVAPMGEHAETFLDDSKLPQQKAATPSAPAQASRSVEDILPVSAQPKQTLSSLQKLQNLLPPTTSPPTSSPSLTSLTKDASSFPSPDPFIYELTSTFESRYAPIRAHHAAARRDRESELETRNNELFERGEIDYGDFEPLEEKFKQEEAELVTQEARKEYELYTRDVFEPIFGRLHSEIGELVELAVRAEGVLRGDGVAGRDALMLDSAGSEQASSTSNPTDEGQKVDLVEALAVALSLDEKIEERHGKVHEAVQERDRMYKKTETAPLHAKGDVKKVKNVEWQFEGAERRAALKAKEEKVERLQRLWDVVDEVVVRGVEQNQDFVDEIVKAVDAVGKEMEKRRTSSAEAPEGDDEDGIQQLMRKTKIVLERLTRGSQALMTKFHEVEVKLHHAEHGAEMAKAKLEGKKYDELEALEREWVGEEGKYKRELERRVGVVEADLGDAVRLVDGVGGKGKEGSKSMEGSGGLVEKDEVDRRERMKAALEDAKRRNGEAV